MNKNTVVLFLESNLISEALANALLFDELIRAELIKDIFVDCIKRGLFNSLLVAIRLLSKELTLEELEAFLGWYVEEGMLYDSQEVAKLLWRELTREELETILAKCVDDGWIRGAQKVAKLIGRELTPYELNVIFEKCTEEEWNEWIQEKLETFSSLNH